MLSKTHTLSNCQLYIDTFIEMVQNGKNKSNSDFYSCQLELWTIFLSSGSFKYSSDSEGGVIVIAKRNATAHMSDGVLTIIYWNKQ